MQTCAVGSYLSSSNRFNQHLNCVCLTLMRNETARIRRAEFKDSATKMGWEFSYAYGFDSVEEGFIPLFKHERSPITGFKPSLPEIACAQSHQSILVDFLESSDDYRLICEDDVLFVSTPPLVLPAHEFDILFLNSRCQHNRYGELWGATSCGTDTYLVSRRGASLLLGILAESDYLHLPLDMLIIARSISMRRMGHHLSRFFPDSLRMLHSYHGDAITVHPKKHPSHLCH